MVEDSPLDQTLYRAYLDELPVEVVCADTLTQALVLLVEWPIDLVLLDLGLPDADADDPLSSLQKIKAVMPDLPVLIVSANEANGNEQQAAARVHQSNEQAAEFLSHGDACCDRGRDAPPARGP